MKTKKTTNQIFDAVVYSKQTGNISTCFDRYPEWLSRWIEQNKNRISSHYVSHNLPDVFIFDENGIVTHDFRVGDVVICFDDSTVKVGQKAIFDMLVRLSSVSIDGDEAEKSGRLTKKAILENTDV